MSTTPSTQTERPAPPTNAVDRYFKITERGSTIGTEIRGGLVTFFTMSYIIVLNPLIIGTVRSGDGLFLGGGDVPNLTAVAAIVGPSASFAPVPTSITRPRSTSTGGGGVLVGCSSLAINEGTGRA